MASQNLPKLGRYLPLWQKRIPKYPLYSKGNPQLRVFLPLFWMKMIHPRHKQRLDYVNFEVHPQMTKFDVKNYLEKIYGVQVLHVRTRIAKGEEIKTFGPIDINEPPKRIAHVLLDEKFNFPEIFKDQPTEEKKTIEEYSKIQTDTEKEHKKIWHKMDVPSWFR